MTLAAALLLAALPVFAAAPKPPKVRTIAPGARVAFHVPGLAKQREDGAKVLERVLSIEVEAPEFLVQVSSRPPRVSWDAARVFFFEYRLSPEAPEGPFVVVLRKTVERKKPKPTGPPHVDVQELRFSVETPSLWGGSALARSLARGVALFFAALLGHVILWRRRAPKRHVPALLGAFGVPALMYAVFAPAAGCALWADLLAYASLAAAYMQSYPAAQAQSPTLLVAEVLGREPLGLSTEELAARIPPKKLVGDRVKDLLDAGLVEPGEEEGRVRLTGRGAALLPPFKALRMILGLPEGRG